MTGSGQFAAALGRRRVIGLLAALMLGLGGCAAPRRRTGSRPRAVSTLDSSGVREAQRLLAALGYSPGPIDGLMGPRTAAAARAWQADNGRVATGHVDAALLDGLRQQAIRRPAAATGHNGGEGANESGGEGSWIDPR